MLLDQIPAGSEIFLDANVLLFYFGSDPTYGPACKHVLERAIAGGDGRVLISADRWGRVNGNGSRQALLRSVAKPGAKDAT